jgi:hypothetical protein
VVSARASARRRKGLWRYKSWRFWSVSDPSVHQASYEFADQAALDRATSGEALKPLVAEFDRCWPDVTRTREIFVLAEEFAAG